MPRFVACQPDLFAPPAAPAAPAPAPLDELNAMLERFRALEDPPWLHAAAAMADDLHALGLAKLAGPEGERIAAAILLETERLIVIADRRQQG